MSLDISLYKTVTEIVNVFDYNVTHNLTEMAEAAGLYEYLWNPHENNITKAYQLIEPLTKGLQELLSNPEKYKAYNPDNGWGSYEGLVAFVDSYLKACKQHPEAEIDLCK